MTSAPVPPVPHTPAPPPLKRRKSRKLWIILGVALFVAVALVGIRSLKNVGPKGTKVQVEKAVVRSITETVTATGKVQPETEVRISSEAAGELIEIPVEEGQMVRKGQVLARIKDDYYKAQLDQQQAALVASKATSVLSKARLVKAQSDYEQAEQLFAKKLISDSEHLASKTSLDVAKAEYDSALAQIRRTEGMLNQAKDLLEKTTVFAPMDGTISSLTSKVGERVLGTGQFAGTEIMRIADLDHMEVRVKVNENDILKVKLGDNTVVSVDAFAGRRFKGEVREISSSAISLGGAGSNAAAQAASASDEVTNFLVKIRILDSDPMFRPGMSATVDVETRVASNVVAVPVQSVTVRASDGKSSDELQEERKKEMKEKSGNDLEAKQERDLARRDRDRYRTVVFVREGAKVRLAEVEVGISDTSWTEIRSGVKEGEEIVSGSYQAISKQLKDGAEVIVEQPKKEDKKS